MSQDISKPVMEQIDLTAYHVKKTFSNQSVWKKTVYAFIVIVFFAYGGYRNSSLMDIYEEFILGFSALGLVVLGWFWSTFARLTIGTMALSLLSIALYGGDLMRADQVFGLKYMLASQPAVMWMCVLFLLATLLYWGFFALRKPIYGWLASQMVFAGWLMGTVALMVRWHEGYLIAVDVGHIPVSNLYEVFILFSLMTAGFYLYYEEHYQTRQLGAFVMLVVCAAIGFLLWYSFERGQQEIKPLIPALQSWWMKIHVPANFVGYGTFSIAAMVGFAYLVKFVGTPFQSLPKAFQTKYGVLPAVDDPSYGAIFQQASMKHAKRSRVTLWVLWVLGALLFIEPLVFRKGITAEYLSTYWALYFGVGLCVVGVILLLRKPLAERLPDFHVLDDMMYKAVAIGFVFFTIATILGAFWAADAWGKYWSWDPKETWALIVWLNYAAWLHLRLMAGFRGVFSSVWALLGLLITGFAFLGVNIFLSGLHSYGSL